MERTLVLIKPDGVQRGLIGEVITRLERRGLKLVGLKFMQMTQELAAQFYAEHKGKGFYENLIGYITSAPLVAMAWEGKQAIKVVRETMGKTNPVEAAPGTIRGDLAVEIGRNVIHCSADAEAAVRELGLIFREEELIAWERDTDRWIFE